MMTSASPPRWSPPRGTTAVDAAAASPSRTPLSPPLSTSSTTATRVPSAIHALSFQDFMHRGGRNSSPPQRDDNSLPRAGLSPSHTVSGSGSPTPPQGRYQHQQSSSPLAGATEVSPQTKPPGSGLLMRKSLQGLLARVHDVTQFVADTGPPAALNATAGTSPGADARNGAASGRNSNYSNHAGPPDVKLMSEMEPGASAEELADRLAGLSSALAAWGKTSDVFDS